MTKGKAIRTRKPWRDWCLHFKQRVWSERGERGVLYGWRYNKPYTYIVVREYCFVTDYFIKCETFVENGRWPWGKPKYDRVYVYFSSYTDMLHRWFYPELRRRGYTHIAKEYDATTR